MLLGMAGGLPASDARIAGLHAAAAAHREAGLRAVTGAHYEGGHWLGTFAVYLVTTESSRPAATPVAARADVPLGERVAALTRASSWTLERTIPMTFPAHHPQGLVKIGDRLFFSSVEVTTPPRRGAGDNGFDRDTGQGVGHLFEATMDGRLVADVVLGEGTVYHPGGLDFDGRDIWVPVAEYRPDSRSIVYRVDPTTRKAVEVFRFGDHLGGVACDTESRTLHAVSWGSRWIYRFPLDASGRPTNAEAPPATLRAANRSQYVDYQDCKYVGAQQMLCSGIADVPGGAGERPLQLGGIDLVDLASAAPLHQLPVGLRTPGGASLTRNPSFFEAADGGGIRAYFLPDDDKTTLYVYRIR
jgi:hypothetical protein